MIRRRLPLLKPLLLVAILVAASALFRNSSGAAAMTLFILVALPRALWLALLYWADNGRTRFAELPMDVHAFDFASGLVSVGKALQSWQYRSRLPGTLDDWYVIGCKWTPFEISYYVNGRLMKSAANHSPYSTVTFDAKNHAALNCPLHIIFSGCIMRGWGRRDTTGFKFPEYFKIDHVRYWEYPKDDPSLPKVAWKMSASLSRWARRSCSRRK